MKYNVSSLLAVAFAFFAFNANATTHEVSTLDLNDAAVQMDLTDNLADGAISNHTRIGNHGRIIPVVQERNVFILPEKKKWQHEK